MPKTRTIRISSISINSPIFSLSLHDIPEMAPTIGGIMCGHSLSRNAFNHHNSPSIVLLNLTRGGKTAFKCLFMARKAIKQTQTFFVFPHCSGNTFGHVLKKWIFLLQKQNNIFFCKVFEMFIQMFKWITYLFGFYYYCIEFYEDKIKCNRCIHEI